VQFYNQGNTQYDNYDILFVNASTGTFNGTALKQIINRGIPSNKLIVGKPVKKTDASNTGWMDITILGEAVSRAYSELNWYGGVMFWQFNSDSNGT
jgi:chitinase